MKADFVIILALSILSLFVGFFIAGYMGMKTSFFTGYGEVADFIILCATAFVFSTLLNGYGAPFFTLYLGTISTDLLFKSPVAALIQLAGIFMASYAGVVFSYYVKKDFEGKDNMFMHTKEFALPLAFAFVICTVAALSIAYMPNSKELSEAIVSILG